MRAWLLLLSIGCGRDPDFVPPPRDDMRITLDLASSYVPENLDMTCFNTACGGCSSFANWDGTAVKVGDPRLWKGAWQCTGNQLSCSDNGCPMGGTPMTGSGCAPHGHTILDLTHPGSGCRH